MIETNSNVIGDAGCDSLTAVPWTSTKQKFAAETAVTWTSNKAGEFFADDACTTELTSGRTKAAAGVDDVVAYYLSAVPGDHVLSVTAEGFTAGSATLQQLGLCTDVAEPVTTKVNFTASSGFDEAYLAELNDAGGHQTDDWFKYKEDGADTGKFLFHIWSSGLRRKPRRTRL